MSFKNKLKVNPINIVSWVIIIMVFVLIIYTITSNNDDSDYLRMESCMRTYHDYDYCKNR